MILISIFLILLNVNSNAQVLEEWRVRNQSGLSKSMDIDKYGNIYVGGDKGNEIIIDFCLIKYSSSGNQQWVANYNGPTNGFDFGHAVKLDRDENII